MAEDPKVPSGVQSLISRLRDEGVKAGQQEAERLVEEAQQQAAQILNRAKTEAEELREKAHRQIEADRVASHEAIQMAFRDTLLKLGSEIRAAFSAHVKRLVSMELEERDFLRKCILLIVGYAGDRLPKDQPLEVLIADDLFVAVGDKTELTETGKERLRDLVLGISREMLREGVDLKPAGHDERGMKVRLVGEDLELDLSDKALSEVLLQYLTPRFRAIFIGVE
jgi:V/A-type H+-transporting ATPase subunit E